MFAFFKLMFKYLSFASLSIYLSLRRSHSEVFGTVGLDGILKSDVIAQDVLVVLLDAIDGLPHVVARVLNAVLVLVHA